MSFSGELGLLSFTGLIAMGLVTPSPGSAAAAAAAAGLNPFPSTRILLASERARS